MKYSRKICYFFAVLSFLTSCSTANAPVDKPSNTETKHIIQIEPTKGRLNVETSAARALKYNLEAVKHRIQPKFIGEEARENALINLRKLRENQPQSLATSLKELDFAILYTSVNLQTHPDKIDAYLTQATAQNIVLGAIKSHKNTMYSNKKIFELRRKIRQQQKQIESLIKKASSTESPYRKELENSIDALILLTKQLEQNVADFKQLVKADSAKIELEGKGFYDRTILPPQSTAEPYQRTAFSQRQEMKDFSPTSFESIDQTFKQEQPLLSSSVKGFYIADTSAQQYLSSKGDSQASDLLQATLAYQKAGKKKQQKLLAVINEEMSKAVYLQVALAHELAKKISADYEAQKASNKELSQKIRKLEKTSHPSEQQKIDLLHAKIDLIKNELIEDDILAERAMTVTALRFYGEQLYFTPEILKKDISGLANYLKQSFEKKLSSLEAKEKNASSLSENPDIAQETADNWAHKENWLEILMAENKNYNPQKLISKPVSGTKDFNAKTILQLGAFLDKESAAKEWQTLSLEFPELQKYQPLYEQTSAAGIAIFRLVIKSPNGGFKDLCIRLRNRNHECFLRD